MVHFQTRPETPFLRPPDKTPSLQKTDPTGKYLVREDRVVLNPLRNPKFG